MPGRVGGRPHLGACRRPRRTRCGRPRPRRPTRRDGPDPTSRPARPRRPARRRRARAGAAGRRRGRGELLVGRAPVHARAARPPARPRRDSDRVEHQTHARTGRGRGWPRPTLRRSVASSGTSSEVRSSGSDAESGLANRTASRRGSSAGRPSASTDSGETNGYDSTSTYPSSASARPDAAAAALAAVSPWPAGASGSSLGTWSYPSRRITSSARSAGSVRSGRQVGGRDDEAAGAGRATVAPICLSSAVTRLAGYADAGHAGRVVGPR